LVKKAAFSLLTNHLLETVLWHVCVRKFCVVIEIMLSI